MKRKDLVVLEKQNQERYRGVACLIAESASPREIDALQSWAQYLLDVQASKSFLLVKMVRALSPRSSLKAALPLVKIAFRRTKRHVWDDRSTTARVGMGGMLIGATVLSGKKAGIAALGTAIGVPLWVVFGAGASFLNVLREELFRKKHGDEATYTVIDARRIDL